MTSPTGAGGGPVPPHVLAAFALRGAPEPLPGGRGLAVRVGAAVLRPDPDAVAGAWAAGVADRLRAPDVRLPRPLRAGDGRWVVDGWTATEHVDGLESPADRWSEVLEAGRALSRALAAEPPPPWLAARADPWAVADRAAWGEAAPEPGPAAAPLVGRLLAARGPLPALSEQLVHGDLTGNVLLPRRPGTAPTVIDLSPYRRPAAAALAVVVVDGWLWHDAGPELVDLADLGPAGPQLLLRAMLFRLLALDALARDAPEVVAAELPRHERAARAVLDLAGR